MRTRYGIVFDAGAVRAREQFDLFRLSSRLTAPTSALSADRIGSSTGSAIGETTYLTIAVGFEGASGVGVSLVPASLSTQGELPSCGG
jgi:hypothetical protein